MACSRSFRLVATVSALLFATLASSTRASDNACSATDGIKVQDARLLVVPDVNSTKLTLSGHALIGDPDKLSGGVAYAFCAAAIGDKFRVNNSEVCRLFSFLSGNDTVKPDGKGFEFALSRRLDGQSREVSIRLPAGESICAYGLVIEVLAGPRGHFGFIDNVPKSLTEDRAEFEVIPGARSRDLNIRLFIVRDAEEVPNERTMKGPKSWAEPIEGLRLQRLMRAVLLSVVVALFLTFFEKAHPLRATFGSVSTYLKSPVTAAMAFYMAGALTECVGDAANLILRLNPDSERFLGWISEGIRAAAHTVGTSSLNILAELLLHIAVFVAVSLIYYPLVRPFCRRGPVVRVIAFPVQVTVYASLISAAGLVFGILVLLTERKMQWLGFEAPAFLISLFYALIGVCALRRLFNLSRSRIIAIALLVSLTVFFPADPVLRSSFVVSIGDNTRIWARFLCYSAADFVYIAALTGFAFRIAGSDELHDRLVARWLMFLLILQVASFAIGNPTNMVAVAGVVLLSSRWLLAPEDPTETPVLLSSGSIDWEMQEETFPFIVGGAAAFIFLIQFIFEAGGSEQSRRFVLLGLANVPRTFAIGAVAALVLSRVGPYLRGDSATLKAVNVSALILLASMAGSLAGLQGRERLIAVLASNLGMIASLILCSVVVYDLQRAKSGNGDFEWRNVFKGTTLAQAIPIVSAVAVALFSALSPIFIREIGDAFGTLLKIALPQVPAGN